MPRLAPLGVVAVAALSLSLVACSRSPDWATSPIMVKIQCDDGVTVGMTDPTGRQAWSVGVRQGQEVEWRVESNVTIKVSSKTSEALPLVQPTPVGDGRGKPATSTVKDDAKPGHYPYKVEAKCRRADGSTINVTLDPDIIVW